MVTEVLTEKADTVVLHTIVKAVTVPIDDSRLTPKFIEQVHKLGKRVYVHTIQTYESLTKYAAINVDGFYTGLLTPQDMAVYESVSK